MMRLFTDSSVLFSAAYSARGHARELVIRGVRGELTLVISELVLEETRRNLAQNSPGSMPLLEFVIESIPFEIVRPRKSDVLDASEHTALKDAPIVAAARHAKVDLLVTLDKKHLLGRPELTRYLGADILTPAEAVERLNIEDLGSP